MTQQEYEKKLKEVPGLAELINEYHKQQDTAMKLFLMEFALHGLAEFSLISKHHLSSGLSFKDLLSSMFTLPRPGEDEDEDDDDDEAIGGKF
jgi:magnesium chelatase subunit I